MNNLLILLTLLLNIPQQNVQPVELGQVSWMRNYDEAIRKSAKNGKPVFILFQEVPGCHTCSKFGKEVISHPFIVEAIETYFIPLAIYNNKGGHDKKILERYGEPSWNNPVVRIVNASGKDIVKRESGRYSESAILERIIEAMYSNNILIPEYLKIYQKEVETEERNIEEATFSMYCFWTGEKELGKLDGVLETEAGFINGHEVVNVRFEPSRISYKELLLSAKNSNCADAVYTDNTTHVVASEKLGINVHAKSKFRKDKESKYHLYKSKFRGIPMTRFQATKVNSLLGRGMDPSFLLSPRQLAKLNDSIDRNFVGKEIKEAWWNKA